MGDLTCWCLVSGLWVVDRERSDQLVALDAVSLESILSKVYLQP